MIYLDYAANTPISEEALEIFCKTNREYIANPNSNHQEGRRANTFIKECTQRIANNLKVLPEEIIYTSSASESNNMVIKGIATKYKRNGKHLITTYLEHSSLNSAIMGLTDQGYEVDFVGLDENGQVDLQQLKELLREDTILVSVSYIDSELGLIQPIQEIAQILSGYSNCKFHVDATQAVGKIPVDFTGVDLITLTAHKFFGPNGIGLLIKRQGTELVPLIEGGLSTTIYRSGTPTLSLIASMDRALELAINHIEETLGYVKQRKQQLLEGLRSYGNVVIHSNSYTSPYILNLSLKGIKSKEFVYALDQQGICVSTKSACCPENAVSKPVFAFTKDRKLALNPMRISFSGQTTEEEVLKFLNAFDGIYKTMVG